MGPITPADHFVLTIWHWIAGFIITGGGGAALLTWWLSQRKKRPATQHPHEKALDDHKEDDRREFTEIKSHLEKQWDVLLQIQGDLGKVKGKLGI